MQIKNSQYTPLNVIIFTQNRKIITFKSKNKAGQTKNQKPNQRLMKQQTYC